MSNSTTLVNMETKEGRFLHHSSSYSPPLHSVTYPHSRSPPIARPNYITDSLRSTRLCAFLAHCRGSLEHWFWVSAVQLLSCHTSPCWPCTMAFPYFSCLDSTFPRLPRAPKVVLTSWTTRRLLSLAIACRSLLRIATLNLKQMDSSN